MKMLVSSVLFILVPFMLKHKLLLGSASYYKVKGLDTKSKQSVEKPLCD